MKTKTNRACQAKDPKKCAYHTGVNSISRHTKIYDKAVRNLNGLLAEAIQHPGLDVNEAIVKAKKDLAVYKQDALESAAKSRYTSKKIIDNLSQNEDENIRIAVAGNPELSKKVIERLSNDESAKVREALIHNKAVSAKTVEALAGDPHRDVREIVAIRTKSTETLDKLSQDPEVLVRHRVARNELATQETTDRLAEDPRWEVRESVAWRGKVSITTLVKLSGDERSEVRHVAKDNLSLKKHDPEEIREAIAARNAMVKTNGN